MNPFDLGFLLGLSIGVVTVLGAWALSMALRVRRRVQELTDAVREHGREWDIR